MLVMVVLTVGVTAALTKTVAPTYRSSTVLFVASSTTDSGSPDARTSPPHLAGRPAPRPTHPHRRESSAPPSTVGQADTEEDQSRGAAGHEPAGRDRHRPVREAVPRHRDNRRQPTHRRGTRAGA